MSLESILERIAVALEEMVRPEIMHVPISVDVDTGTVEVVSPDGEPLEDIEEEEQELSPVEHKALVKTALTDLQVAKGVEAAKGVLTDHDAATIGKLAVDKYDSVIAACEDLMS